MNTRIVTRKLARRLGAMRMRKIRRIEERLMKGTYRVQASEVAKALLLG